MKFLHLLFLVGLGLLLAGCGPSVQSSRLTDKEIVDKYFGEAAHAKYDNAGRVTLLTCPQWFDPFGEGVRKLLFMSTTCKAGKNIPPEIGQLAKLEELTIYSPNFATLPPEIGLLRSLEILKLGNRLTTLPPEIGQLTNLRKLELGVNELTSLPPEIGQLANLCQWQFKNIPKIGNLGFPSSSVLFRVLDLLSEGLQSGQRKHRPAVYP